MHTNLTFKPCLKKIQYYFFSFLVVPVLKAQIETAQKAIVYYYDGSVFQGKIVSEDALQIVLIPSTQVDTLHIAKEFIGIYSGSIYPPFVIHSAQFQTKRSVTL